jgi:hypothetical protein
MPLDPQRTLFIGMPASAIPARTYKFFDMFNVNEFKLIVWNTETFISDTQEKTGQSFQRPHHPFIYRQFKELYDEKMVQILNWIKVGNVLILFPSLFELSAESDGRGRENTIDVNQFPPFNLVELAHKPGESLEVAEGFSAQFFGFVEMLRYDVVLSGEEIVPLFRTRSGRQEPTEIVGAAFRVGKGAIVFSPPPKAWNNPKLIEYLDALAKLPDLLSFPLDPLPEWKGAFHRLVEYFDAFAKLPDVPGQPLDPLPERTRTFHRTALRLAAFPALLIAAVALSPFWAPHVARLLPWGEKPPAAGQDYDTFAARLSEIEKRPASPSFDVDAIKSGESTLAHRVDQLEAALSRLQEPAVAPPSNAPDATTTPEASARLSTEQAVALGPPAASPHLSAEEIAELLARGDMLLHRGDVASARLFYERAASGGDGRSALRLGATFDPAFLDRDVLRGVRGDLGEARIWYQRARDLGEAEAERRLKSLKAKEGEKSP